jgi:hypothetical protein
MNTYAEQTPFISVIHDLNVNKIAQSGTKCVNECRASSMPAGQFAHLFVSPSQGRTSNAMPAMNSPTPTVITANKHITTAAAIMNACPTDRPMIAADDDFPPLA